MPTDVEIEEFIGDSFTSVWDIELLGALVGADGQAVSSHWLMQQMRASELIVERGARLLVSIGLASVEDDQAFRFTPASEPLDQCARAALAFYRRYPGRVRRLIVNRQSPGLTAFADAFRIRKDPQ